MYVELCWKTKETEKGKVHVSKRMTVKKAMKMFDQEVKPIAIKAYLRHFDGWHYRIYKRLIDNSSEDLKRYR